MRQLILFFTFTLCLSTLAYAAPDAAGNRALELNDRGAHALQAGKFKEAEDFFSRALTADKHNLTIVLNLASAYLINKKEPSAVSLLQDYCKLVPRDAALQARLGDALFAQKKVTEAAAAYEKAFKLNSREPQVASRLGMVYSLQNRPKDAEKMVTHALELDPKNAQLLANLSSLQLANGKTDDSIATAKRALQLSTSSDVYITLGTAYEIKKDYKNALIAFERAADLGDGSKELKEKISTLRKIS